MEDFSVFNKQQLKEIIYEVVSECFDDKSITRLLVESPKKRAFMTVMRYASFCISPIPLYGVLRKPVF